MNSVVQRKLFTRKHKFKYIILTTILFFPAHFRRILEVKMSHWTVGVVVLVLLHAVIANGAERPKGSGKKMRRQYSIRRPALLNRNPSHVDFPGFEESIVKYDPSGLGFEFQLPFNPQYQTGFETEPTKSSDRSKTPDVQQESTHAPEGTEAPVPVYSTTPFLEPIGNSYYSEYTSSKGSYKLAPPSGAASPEGPKKYGGKYSYYCPKVGGYHSQCRPAIDCSVWYEVALSTPGSACTMEDGDPGICCPDIPYNGVQTLWHLC